MRERGAELEGVNLLEVAPVRAADWSEAGGRVVLELRAPASPWRAPLRWLGYLLSTKSIRLDEAGSLAWRLLDGRRTVREVAVAMRSELGDAVEPAEERLGTLVRMLRRGGMLSYPGVDALDGGG